MAEDSWRCRGCRCACLIDQVSDSRVMLFYVICARRRHWTLFILLDRSSDNLHGSVSTLTLIAKSLSRNPTHHRRRAALFTRLTRPMCKTFRSSILCGTLSDSFSQNSPKCSYRESVVQLLSGRRLYTVYCVLWVQPTNVFIGLFYIRCIM